MKAIAIGFAACLALAAGAGETGWTALWSESFDTWAPGSVPASRAGWETRAEGANRVEIGAADEGRAVCLLDAVNAPRDASCYLRRTLPTRPGDYRVSFRAMLRQGRAGTLRQDMGLHLFDGSVLLDVFFSGGELKTWQGEGWASLEPPAVWEAERWHEVVVEIAPQKGMAALTVDGQTRRNVRLRRTAGGLTRLEFVSQRYATGELWIDDVTVEHRWPAALRSQPGSGWAKADAAARAGRWFADDGASIRWGRLRAKEGETAVARRTLATDFTNNPILRLRMDAAPEATVTTYLRRSETGEAVLLPPAADGRHALFAATGWDGPVAAEVLVCLEGPGSVRLGDVGIESHPALDYREPEAVARFVRPSQAANRLPKELPLRVDGVPGPLVPVRFGLPFPAGALSRPETLLLRADGGTDLPLGTRPLSYWPDGTIRWLLLDSLVPIPDLGGAEVVLADGKASREAYPPVGRETPEEIVLDNGLLALTIPRAGFPRLGGLPEPCDGTWDFTIRADGRTCRASLGSAQAWLEETGPLRATAVVAGTMAGTAGSPFRYELRLSLARGARSLAITPTFLFVGDDPECQLEEVSLRLGARLAPGIVSFGADVPLSSQRAEGETVRLLQDRLDHYVLESGARPAVEGNRAAGWLLAGDLSVAVRRFPEQFRKDLSVTDREIRVGLWAPGAARRFGRGAAKTHDLLLSFAVPNRREAALLAARNEKPAAFHPGGEWLAHAGGLGRFSLPGEDTRAFDALYAQACERRLAEAVRRPLASYGMVHYGESNHINSEIDAHVALFLEWARTGRRTWLDAALDWALHSQDIDVCHFSPNPREIGIHHSHYPSDHNDGGLTLTHTWIRGQLFRYYLTGDMRSLLAAERAGLAFRRNMRADGRLCDGGAPGSGIGSRGYGRACWALAELFQATRNPLHLDTMERLNRHLAASLRPDGALPASHDGAGVWSRSDECPHMAAICAVGLARHAALLPRAQAEPHLATLRRIADWQLARGTMPEKLGVMYHNYPGGEVIHFVDATSNMLEAWIALYDATREPLYRDLAESTYDAMLEMGDQWRHDWTMGARNVLAYLDHRHHLPQPDIRPEPPADPGADARFLLSCQNGDGGFGLAPGLPSDMDSTYRAVDALRLLGQPLPRGPACARWILSCRHEGGGYAGEPGWHPNVAWTCLALESLESLAVPPPAREETVQWLRSCFQESGGCGSSPVAGPLPYHPAWNPATDYTAYAVQALVLLGEQPPEAVRTRAFLLARQSEHTGFNRFRGNAATPWTALALDALRRLPKPDGEREFSAGLLAWLVSLRRQDGGYSWPGGTHGTLRNTEQVLRSFRALGATLAEEDLEIARRFVRRCRAGTGGFGHRPGRAATVLHTWYGVRAAAMLAPAR